MRLFAAVPEFLRFETSTNGGTYYVKKRKSQSKETRRIYIRSQRRWQEVPEEVYQEHIRFHDTYRHRMQDRGLCCCPRNKWWVCDADCLTCEYRNADIIASLDAPIGEEDDDLILMDTIADESIAVSELASDRIVLEQLFKRLADLMPEAENHRQAAYAGPS